MADRKIPLLIDTDPGVDDAVAIWLALASPEIELLGLTTVIGNGPVAACAENAIRILDAAGRPEIPVHAGAAQPLERSYARPGWGVHGADGLGGIGLPAPSRRADGGEAVAYLADTLESATPGSVTLALLGPLTNVACLLRDRPRARLGIREVVIMGGAAAPGGGNATPHAEYNFWIDPEAAALVCASGLPMTLVTIETARPVSATPERIARLEAIGGKVGGYVAGMLRNYVHESGADALFDALVIAYLLHPGYFPRIPARIEVLARTSDSPGALDWQPAAPDASQAILQAPDPDAIFDLLVARLKQLP
ncbi:MAG: nucleoside hydrolase [Rhodospirillaceae bacterium]|nr:nucleoside hydrolase [Rhodospirillaceae bacterium]